MRNHLYDIFKEHELNNKNKRKVPPTAVVPSTKSGKLNYQQNRTIDYYFGNGSSPQLRGKVDSSRPRCNTGVTPSKKKRIARRRCSSLASGDPKQQLLTNVWKDLASKCGTGNNSRESGSVEISEENTGHVDQ